MKVSDLQPGLVTPEDSRRIRARVVELQPGEEVGEHSTHENEEVIVVLSGQASVESESGAATVCKGQAAFIPQGERHNVKNEGSEPVRYIYVRSRGLITAHAAEDGTEHAGKQAAGEGSEGSH